MDQEHQEDHYAVHLPSLDRLRTFIVVADELSFTRASRRLHVVQSGVSSAIQGLERELGVALFDRDRHRVILTDAGLALLPEARATLAAAQAAAQAVAAAAAGLRGTLTIGSMPLPPGGTMPRASPGTPDEAAGVPGTRPAETIDLPAELSRFHVEHPRVLVRLRTFPGGSADLAREVLSGALDLALVSVPGEAPPGLRMRPLAQEPLALICPPSHSLTTAGEVSLPALGGEAFIDFPPGWGTRAVVDRAFAAAGLERHVVFEVPDYVTAVGLVRHGLGIAVMPESAVPEGLADLGGHGGVPAPPGYRAGLPRSAIFLGGTHQPPRPPGPLGPSAVTPGCAAQALSLRLQSLKWRGLGSRGSRAASRAALPVAVALPAPPTPASPARADSR